MDKRILCVGVLGVSMIMAACGSSSKSTSSSTTAGSTGSTTSAASAFSSAAETPGPQWSTAAANSQLLSLIGSYPTATGSTTRGINGNTISIGCIAPDTDQGVPTVYAGFCDGVKARLMEANDSKQTPYTFNLTSSQDTGTQQPTQTTDITADVDSSHDFALLLDSALGPVGSNILESQHVPYFGNFTDCGKNSIFGFSLDYDIETCTALESETGGKWETYTNATIIAFTKPKGLAFNQVRYAGLAYNQGILIQYLNILESQFKAEGVQIVGNSTSLPANSASTVDLSPYVTPIVADKPNIIGIYSADPTLTARLMGALKQAGYTGGVSAACTASELQNPAVAAEIDGCLATSITNGYASFGGPNWAQLTAEAKALNQPTPVTDGFTHGWFESDILVQGLQAFAKTGKPLTSENLVNFMNAGWVYPGFGNVVSSTIFPYAKYGSPPCASIAVENAKLKKETPYQDLTCGQVFFSKI